MKCNYVLTGFFIFFVIQLGYAQSQNIETLDQLNSYLEKSLSMGQMVSNYRHNQAAFNRDLAMINNVKPKRIIRLAGRWGNIGDLQEHFDDASAVADAIKSIDSDIILEAAIFEIVTREANEHRIPDYVLLEYNQAVSIRYFDYESMIYPCILMNNCPPSGGGEYRLWEGSPCENPGTDNEEGNCGRIPDISQVETQMWFYYLITEFMKRGYECFHLGQTHLMNENDPLHYSFYSDLLTRCRTYYRDSINNNRVALFNANTQYEPPNQTETAAGMYNGNPIFDFGNGATRLTEVKPSLRGNNQMVKGCGGSIIDLEAPLTMFKTHLQNKTSGWHPSLEMEVDRIPIVLLIDNYGNDEDICSDNTLDHYVWGYDEIEWFIRQSECYRHEWMENMYAYVHCISEDAHLSFRGHHGKYRANTSDDSSPFQSVTLNMYGYPEIEDDIRDYGDEEKIKEIWSTNSTVQGWVHDYTRRNSIECTVAGGIASYPNHIFYIASNGRIGQLYKSPSSSEWSSTMFDFIFDAKDAIDCYKSNVFYMDEDNNINHIYWSQNAGDWFSTNVPYHKKADDVGELSVYKDHVYYIGEDKGIYHMWLNNSNLYYHKIISVLNNAKSGLSANPGTTFYRDTNNKLNIITYNSSTNTFDNHTENTVIVMSDNIGSRTNNAFFISENNEIAHYVWDPITNSGSVETFVVEDISLETDILVLEEKVYFKNIHNELIEMSNKCGNIEFSYVRKDFNDVSDYGSMKIRVGSGIFG